MIPYRVAFVSNDGEEEEPIATVPFFGAALRCAQEHMDKANRSVGVWKGEEIVGLIGNKELSISNRGRIEALTAIRNIEFKTDYTHPQYEPFEDDEPLYNDDPYGE